MESMTAPHFLSFPRLTPTAVIDILVVAFLIYQFFMIIRGRRAISIIVGVLTLVGVYVAAVVAGLGLLRTLLETLAPYTVFALIVVFQSDIRRLLARLGRRRWIGAGAGSAKREFAEEIVLTLSRLSQQQTGALVVLERDIGLRTFVESGVRIDGELSRDLLLAIFEPNGALHDGAVIVQGDRVAAAACFLPLSMNPRLMTSLGTRHRAAIGVTEETDCLALVVSEETGRLSYALGGEIVTNVTLDEAEQAIVSHFGRRIGLSATPGSEESGAISESSRAREAGQP
jgi:diadenylate cyclase